MDEVGRRGRRLGAYGVKRADIVAIIHGNSAAFVADLLAVWQCGATALVLDPGLADGELDNLVRFVKPVMALRDSAERAIAQLRTVCLDADDTVRGVADATATHSADDTADDGPDDLALILVTSGTTGTPKAVGLTHRALQNRVQHNRRAIGDAALARALVTLSTSFGHGLIGSLLTPLFSGGDVVFPPRGASLARDFGPLIDAHQITFTTAVPSLWRMALKMSRAPQQGSLRRVHVGSAPLSEQLWRDIARWTGAETVNCYGLTEVANWFSGASSSEGPPRSGLVGRPWGGQAAVLTADGGIAAQGDGELLIDSPSWMNGYLYRPDLTSDCMIGAWYRTGDFGEIGDDGQIVLHGRLKDEINRAGTKIQPAEIDMLVEGHPSVEEVCTFACPDSVAGEIVAIAVVLKLDATETADSLAQWCRARIRRTAIPERWYFVLALPRTPRGKMRRDQVYLTVVKEKA